MKAKNKCTKCGGSLLIEAVGKYGDVYRLKRDGKIGETRIRTHKYEHTGEYLVYCCRCGQTYNAHDYGY